MDSIIIKAGNNEYTYYPAINKCGSFEYAVLEDSFFVNGSTCNVFLALNDKNERFLIKRYNSGKELDSTAENIASELKARYNKQGANYILNELYIGIDNYGRYCKVFEYKQGHVFTSPDKDISIFNEENKEKLYEILLYFASFLSSLKLLHAEIDGVSYLHNDIKLENTFALKINDNDTIAQMIDLDSVCSQQYLVEKIESDEIVGDSTFAISTTQAYYRSEDINYLCKLRGEELRKYIRVLDTTAATRMLSMMLFGTADGSINSYYDDYDSDESIQRSINDFMDRGIKSGFTERFLTASEMLERIYDILKKISSDLPQTIRTAKLLAMSDNEYIDERRIFYREKNNYDKDYSVYIEDLCDEIDEGILPYLQKNREEKVCFEDILNESRDNYILTAEGGGGKTTTLFHAFLKNISDIGNDELYIYIPLSRYRKKDSMLNFISRESGFSFKELAKNNSNKITIFLDAFDEINYIRICNENERKEFTRSFFDDLKTIKNVRIIITSRMTPDDESGSLAANFKTASVLPLEEEQIKGFLKLDRASYDEMCKNNSLQTLLKNPFMLDIYKQVKDNMQDEIQIHSAADLLEQYFWQMYKSKQNDCESENVKNDFKKRMWFVSASAFFEYKCNSYLNKKDDVELIARELKCYYPIIELYENNSYKNEWHWHIRFSHMLFKEYFEARYFFAILLSKIRDKKINDKDIHLFTFSYQTLIFVAQMLRTLQIKYSDISVKKALEDIFQDTVKSDKDIRNLLRVITFFMDGNLQEFNFGDYFMQYEFPHVAFSKCTEIECIIFSKGLCRIGSFSFEDCTSLTSITIPNSLTSIGSFAFVGCTNLMSIIIPNSVTSIGTEAFSGCTSLTNIKIPDSVASIGSGAFSGCTSLTNITIPNSVTSIGEDTFRGCTSLTSIIIPDSITSIEDGALSDCTSLKSITILKSVTSIGKNAFSGCTSLTNITIPNSVISIGKSAFHKCTSLTSVTISDSVTSIGSDAFSGCTSLTNITIPNSVTSIDEFTFSDCTSLTNITMPNSLTNIGKSAFQKCTSLISITIPNSVTSIGECAFWGCISLTSITIHNSITNIEKWAFGHCTSLTSITIPDSITRIGESAFEECTSLTSITIPNSVTSIRKSTFSECTSLKSITIPNSVTSIDDGAFRECTSLKSITIPNSVTSIGKYAFGCCTSITNILIPDSVRNIGVRAFRGCDELTNVIIGSGVTSIAGSAFEFCHKLTTVTLSDSVVDFNAGALAYCPALKEIVVSKRNSVYKSIDGNLYTKDGKALVQIAGGKKAITIPDSVIRIDEDAFKGVFGLVDIIVSEDNLMYKSIDGSLYTKDGATLIRYAGERENTTFNILSNVMSIGNRAFYASNLVNIIMSNNVTSIGVGAFEECHRLNSIIISDSVISISDLAFMCCENLTSITIPNSVTSIGECAFWGCTSLTSITIHNSVTNIEEWAFGHCTSLTSITIPDSVTSIGNGAFRGCTSLTNVTISNGVTDIFVETFIDCVNLKGIVIPNSVTSISDYAFTNCKSLTSVIIPDSVMSIGAYAFADCKSLTSIIIPDSVKSIDCSAFEDCSTLTSIVFPDCAEMERDAFSGCVNLKFVFYRGSKVYFNNDDEIKDYAESFSCSATIYFYSEESPTEEGNFWHYVDGVETIW